GEMARAAVAESEEAVEEEEDPVLDHEHADEDVAFAACDASFVAEHLHHDGGAARREDAREEHAVLGGPAHGGADPPGDGDGQDAGLAADEEADRDADADQAERDERAHARRTPMHNLLIPPDKGHESLLWRFSLFRIEFEHRTKSAAAAEPTF